MIIKTYPPSVQKRARDMYLDSRRGPQVHVTWAALDTTHQTKWLEDAMMIEQVIMRKLNK